MRKKVILITGAAGEVGQSLVQHLAETNGTPLLTIDIRELPAEMKRMSTHLVGDILDKDLFARLIADYELDRIYHLAALLSTRSEFTPATAHKVNVEGTMSLLELASEQSRWRRRPVMFIFPSSIAVYGLPDLETKERYSRVREFEWNNPTTMYGCNKLYGELLGDYYAKNYQQLSAEPPVKIDFRCVRYPGLISAFTVPSGGTSDYASEMIHAAAQGQDYACFVREGLTIPFMAMPDAVDAVLDLADAPRENLSQTVYNIAGFSISAGEIRDLVRRAFPGTNVSFEPDEPRQRIAESWPIDLDDSPARRDWSWAPKYDAERTFSEYLIPNIVNRYSGQAEAIAG
ncbi:MAG TPA: NAD-dependent epimerase/dehydratase family protein [Anaerolineales bacterium]|nr:NAD-dependent epimerase/dehydratase family protein [Anaerolineales bacterium]